MSGLNTKRVLIFGVFILVLLVNACNNGGPTSNPAPTVIKVTIDPLTTAVTQGETRQFSAEVIGTNEPSQEVKWTLDENEEIAAGTKIDSNGLLTVSDEQGVGIHLTVRATSIADESVSGMAGVTVITTIQPATYEWVIEELAFGTEGIKAIAYANGSFIIAGDDGEVAWSTDGKNWTTVSTSSIGGCCINAIDYYNGVWFTAGDDGVILYSEDDGKTWSKYAGDTGFGSDKINGMICNPNLFVAVGDNNKIYTLTPPTSPYTAPWTPATQDFFKTVPAGEPLPVNGIAYGQDTFIAVGGNGTIVILPSEGSWTEISDSTFGLSGINAITFDDGRFVAVGDNGKIAYSDNGSSWTAVKDSATNDNLKTVASDGNGHWVAAGNGRIVESTDNGVTWKSVVLPSDFSFFEPFNDVIYANGKWYIVTGNNILAFSEM